MFDNFNKIIPKTFLTVNNINCNIRNNKNKLMATCKISPRRKSFNRLFTHFFICNSNFFLLWHGFFSWKIKGFLHQKVFDEFEERREE